MDPAPRPAAAAAPPPGAVVVNVAAATARVGPTAPAARVGPAAPAARVGPAAPAAATAPAPKALKLNLRRARWALLALALLVLGFATAYLACFAMTLPLANSGVQGCARTEEEAADLREAAELLLVSASAQVLAATAALLVPALPVTFVAYLVGSYTAFSAGDVLWMLLACHGGVHGVAAFTYWTFNAVLYATIFICFLVVIARP